MTKLPKPFAAINGTSVFTVRTVKVAYEQGRRDMLDEVLKIAPDAMAVLLERLGDGK